MRAESVAANYAEALFSLGEGSEQTERYAGLIQAIADAVQSLPQARAVLMSPKVTKATKSAILAQTLSGAPQEFVLFLQAVVKRGRQGLFSEISTAYRDLLDEKSGRVRATVMLAHEADADLRRQLEQALTDVVGKEVLAEYVVDADLLGGVIVKINDRVFDGSVRRRMTRLRRQLLAR
ncbi:MAG: ATP synthase F1 subunit delta [Gemmatimonadales bacterium]